MTKYLAVSAIVIVGIITALMLFRTRRSAPLLQVDPALPTWNDAPFEKSAYTGIVKHAAPKHDISGIWNGGAEGGVQAKGALEHPALMPDHPADEIGGQSDESETINPLPYTPLGLSALQAHRPAVGVRAVGPGLQNNPVDMCDPVGFPQMELFELRVAEIAQTKNQVLFLNQFGNSWRIIWIDGRPLPDPHNIESRWNGYSVGRWADDYTFVAETVGMDERTWLDNAGRPHTIDMKVEERFHRVDYETLQLTVTIDDPKYYTQPWKAMNNFVLHRLPDNFDIEEFICSPSETAEYNKLIGNPASKTHR